MNGELVRLLRRKADLRRARGSLARMQGKDDVAASHEKAAGEADRDADHYAAARDD